MPESAPVNFPTHALRAEIEVLAVNEGIVLFLFRASDHTYSLHQTQDLSAAGGLLVGVKNNPYYSDWAIPLKAKSTLVKLPLEAFRASAAILTCSL